jgi:hypothetical protein
MPTTMIGLAVTLAFSLVAFAMPASVWAAGPTLTVSANGGVHTFDRDELLARTDVVEITTSRDVAYRTPRTYRAVALAKLLKGVAIPPDAVVEAAAQDGFVTQLPPRTGLRQRRHRRIYGNRSRRHTVAANSR